MWNIYSIKLIWMGPEKLYAKSQRVKSYDISV